ncbi:folate-binding protein [Actinobacillus vicugnae]|uniref:CAF17-like 4Fe-4S cluster assembly/insertion protein YgfZ n=1 Tax=Actinobacillus vicugnae TaxID=2573093 RepID=UPI00123F158F|nr:folate-binding protein [Actinobacillus vicugnae]
MMCECSKISNSHPDLCVQLSQYRLIEIAGVDAEKYLQGQLTCDVAKLTDGEHTLTCHCDPKGKMSAVIRLYRQSVDKFIAMIHADLLPEALSQLKKYAVFSKVTFTELDTPIYGVTSGEVLAKVDENSTVLVLPQGQKRAIVWGETLEINADSQLWDLMDIQDGLPILLKANQFELIPQATNLQAVENAISFTKGCYIGQETVARAKYRGANKRAMFTLVGMTEGEINLPEIGGAVEMQLGENWRSTGTILSHVTCQNRLWLQVVMNNDVEADTAFRINGISLSICDLPYSFKDA